MDGGWLEGAEADGRQGRSQGLASLASSYVDKRTRQRERSRYNCRSTFVLFSVFYLPESLFVWLHLNCPSWEFSFLSGLKLDHLTMD